MKTFNCESKNRTGLEYYNILSDIRERLNKLCLKFLRHLNNIPVVKMFAQPEISLQTFSEFFQNKTRSFYSVHKQLLFK